MRIDERIATTPVRAPGREMELHEVVRFLRDDRPGLAVLALVGGSGIGKTHLLRAALRSADVPRAHVLRARASDDESLMEYVVLTDLLQQVAPHRLTSLPGPQRRALEIVMLQRHPSPLEPHDQHAVGLALRELFAGLSADGPIIVAIDDVQQVDAATASALTFVARRVEDEPVRVLVTAPDAGDVAQLTDPWQVETSHVVHLDSLPVDAFSALVGSHRAEMLFPRRVSKLHAAVGGNPAVGLAILDRLEQPAGSAGRLDRFPIPPRFEDVLGAALVDLPSETVEVLRIASVMSRPTVDALASVLDVQQVAVSLGLAVGEGIVELRDQGLRFVDPLLPSYLYHQLTAVQRLRLHRQLGASLDDEAERALHQALATRRPDPVVASAVAQAAAAQQGRGDLGAAAELAVESVRLTPDADYELLFTRAQMSARVLVGSGDIAHAATLLEHTASRHVPGAVRAELLLLLARLRSHTDHAAAAVHLLRLASTDAAEPDLRMRLGVELAAVFVHHGFLHDADREMQQAVGESDGAAAPSTVGLWLDFAAGRLDPVRLTEPDVLDDALLPAAGQPEYTRAAIDLGLGQLEAARARLEALQRRLALTGDDLTGGHVLCRLSELERVAGNSAAALQYADAACTVARRTGQRVLLPFALARRAHALARLGFLVDARAAAEEGVAVAAATGARRAEWLNRWTLGFAALSEGDHERAARMLTPVARGAYAAGFVEPALLRWVPDTVEALVNVGDADTAGLLLEPFETASTRLHRAWAMALAERSRALVLGAGRERAEAVALAEQAIAGYPAGIDPFERARTLLVAGLLHRRQREESQAGKRLHEALQLFEQLDAQTWAVRLRQDLTAVPPAPDRPLTAVESRVAELASTGLTNRQIAGQLFISPKTVEAHLSSVYRKLGIRSRGGLAHHLEGSGASGPVSQ